MTPPDLDRIQALFLNALERDPQDQAAYLDAEARDPAEREAVQDLLDADALEDPFMLDEPLVRLTEPDPDPSGRLVGPYRIERRLGSGGMGAVYLARREDLGREVALKVVRGDLADPLARQRFEAERRTLGRLEHPNIARLYDAGVDADGMPYFAMEYVDGLPVTVYCDRRQLDVGKRLQVFESIGRAVQHAHQQFVVHRDLKPSNVFVTAEGEIKLLDFGIAKVLDEAADGALHTATGKHLLTPAYAAPEQRAGDPVSAASDVYSLGVLLFELLTGTRPDADASSRPSTAVTETNSSETDYEATRQTTTDRLARRLRGDLDVICMKALQPEPERRYASAEAFVEDIRRHLAGLPVSAQPDSVGYRFRKFVERHRQGVLASVVGVLLLAAVVGYYTVRVQAERDRAITEALKAERVSAFLTDLFGAADPFDEVQGDTLRARDLLARGAARVETELADEPEVQATVLSAIGDVYVRLSLLDAAEPLYRRALALRQEHLGDEDPEVAEAYRNLAWLHVQRAEFSAADSLLKLAQTVLHGDRESVEMARVLYVLGTSRYRQADYPTSDSLHQLADGLFRQHLGLEGDETLNNLAQMGHVAEAMGNDSLAAERAATVLERRRARHGDVHPHVAEALNDLAFTLRKQGRYADAEPLYLEAIAIKRALLGDDHPSVAVSLNNLGVLYGISGQYDKVAAPLEEALAIRRARFGDVHPEVASTLSSLSMLAITQEDYDLALARQDEGLSILRQLHDGDHPLISNTLFNQGQVRFQQGRFAQAERIYRDALAMEQRLRDGDHEQVAKGLSNVGAVLIEQGRYSEAEVFLTDALAMSRRLNGPDHSGQAPAMRHLGRIATARGQYEAAERQLVDALRLQEAHLGADHPALGPTRDALVELYEAWGRPAEAVRFRSAE